MVVLIVVSWLVLVLLELVTCDVVEPVDSLKHSSTLLYELQVDIKQHGLIRLHLFHSASNQTTQKQTQASATVSVQRLLPQ